MAATCNNGRSRYITKACGSERPLPPTSAIQKPLGDMNHINHHCPTSRAARPRHGTKCTIVLAYKITIYDHYVVTNTTKVRSTCRYDLHVMLVRGTCRYDLHVMFKSYKNVTSTLLGWLNARLTSRCTITNNFRYFIDRLLNKMTWLQNLKLQKRHV